MAQVLYTDADLDNAYESLYQTFRNRRKDVQQEQSLRAAEFVNSNVYKSHVNGKTKQIEKKGFFFNKKKKIKIITENAHPHHALDLNAENNLENYVTNYLSPQVIGFEKVKDNDDEMIPIFADLETEPQNAFFVWQKYGLDPLVGVSESIEFLKAMAEVDFLDFLKQSKEDYKHEMHKKLESIYNIFINQKSRFRLNISLGQRRIHDKAFNHVMDVKAPQTRTRGAQVIRNGNRVVQHSVDINVRQRNANVQYWS